MDSREALNITFEVFKIKAADIAETSGVRASQISRFRNGRDIYVSTLDALVDALPPLARTYYFALRLQGSPEAEKNHLD